MRKGVMMLEKIISGLCFIFTFAVLLMCGLAIANYGGVIAQIGWFIFVIYVVISVLSPIYRLIEKKGKK